MPRWPDDAPGALCLSFDNLGVDEASSAAAALPRLLEALAERELSATFFCEGVNAELAPDALRKIDAAGHEVAYHAWLHEQWGDLSAAGQAENLARGVDAFGVLGVELSGLRPPGGQLGEGGATLLREAGLRYASPAGEGAGVEDGLALLPFAWRHVDATSMLPGLDPVRKQMTGSPAPIDPDAFTTYLIKEIEGNEQAGGFISIVLHLPLLDWLSEKNLATILNQLSSAGSWVARCDKLADHVLASAELFDNATALDPTSWA
ncbi:MAG TPA: polysaccharide deacetylase family protein [Solirubrobacterales bacterium]|nr:polysaccharide deacetylase family protein [Solirubrobacterales bacterium]